MRRVVVLQNQFVVDLSDQFARLHTQFHLALQVLVLLLDEESEEVMLLDEVLQQHFRRLGVGLVHVVNPELAEVAGNNPSRSVVVWQFRRIAFRLLEGVEQRAVRLADGRTKVFGDTLLLYQHVRGRDMPVDERGMVEVHLIFKTDILRGVFHTEGGEQRNPERLRLAFLVSPPRPVGDKLLQKGNVHREILSHREYEIRPKRHLRLSQK